MASQYFHVDLGFLLKEGKIFAQFIVRLLRTRTDV